MSKTHPATVPRRLLVGLGFALGGLGCGSGLTDPETLTLFVAPQLVECHGVGLQTCMLVREGPDADWTYFYGGIRGFDFEPGFFYELRVLRHRIKNPPVDGSSFRYVLLRLVSKGSRRCMR
jgi:hypothetical protein